MEKVCKKCGDVKRLTEYSCSQGRYRNTCKRCMCLWAKEHYKKDQRAEYRNINKEKLKKSQREYRESGKARENYRKWAASHREEKRLRNKEYSKRNSEKLKEKRQINKGIWASTTNEYKKNYRTRNKSKILESSRKYTQKAVETLNESYVKALLKHKGYSYNDIIEHPKLIECQRIITKIKRLVNENS